MIGYFVGMIFTKFLFLDMHLYRCILHVMSLPVAMSALELKIPPVVLVLLCAFAMWAMPAYARISLAPHIYFALATLTAAIGVAICLAGVISFRVARTTVNPTTPGAASTLVVVGIYRFTRNPMYLGFLFLLLAWAIFLAHLSAFVLLPIFVAYITRFQIIPEETALLQRFGQQFSTYVQSVRRWA